MSEYTYQELIQMQNDALKRVDEMQKRARNTAGLVNEAAPAPRAASGSHEKKAAANRIPMPNDYLSSLKEYAEKTVKQPPAPESPRQGGFTLPGAISEILDGFNLDSDKALILSLLLLLGDDGADELLQLSLLYLLT